MYILGPSTGSAKRVKYVVSITGSFFELTRATLIAKTTTGNVASIFLYDWIITYDVTSYILTDSGTQYLSKFFTTLYANLGTEHIFTALYHTHTNGQQKRNTKTVWRDCAATLPITNGIGRLS